MENVFETDPMGHIATMVSRVEALVVTNMLETAGIYVRADAIHHASVSVNSIALGGHRIWVPNFQYEEASAIIREVGLPYVDEVSDGPRKAILRFFGFWLVLQGSVFLSLVTLVGMSPMLVFIDITTQILGVPVNPQGRADFYLAQEE